MLGVLAGGVTTAVVRNQPAATEKPHPDQWDPRVADIAHFVERKRGLTFKHPVAVEFLAAADFNRKMTKDEAPDAKERAQMDTFVATLRALGLIEGSFDLKKATDTVVSEEILGLYDPDDKVMYVKGAQLTPDVRETVAHELTHALQDQHFDLNKFDDAGSGTQTAYHALVEADATRVEDAYTDTLSEADQKAIDQTRSQQVDRARSADVPDVLDNLFEFPYVFGPAFVAALEHQGGNVTIDHAFEKPPVSEAQIVDPQSYLSDAGVTKVAAPRLLAGQSKIEDEDPDDFGQVSLLMVLGQRLDYGRAWPAVQGWAGDQYVTYREGGKVCVGIATAWRSPADADRFAAAAAAWVGGMATASSTRPAPTAVEFRSCDPGTAATVQKPPTPSPFDVLAVRSQIISSAEDQGVSLAVATCAADRIIAEFGPAATVALNDVTDENDPRLERFQTAAARIGTACRRTAG